MSAEQGSAERGAGARLRDATVQPIIGASFLADPYARLWGQIPRGAPLPPVDAPRLRGCDGHDYFRLPTVGQSNNHGQLGGSCVRGMAT